MFTSKKIVFLPFITLAIVFIFSLTLFPSVQPTPKNMPIAIVNEDEGGTIPQKGSIQMGNQMVDAMKDRMKQEDEPAVQWVEVKSKKAMLKGMDEQKYYGALVIPKDFTAKQLSLQTPKPQSAELQLYSNQGMNGMAAAASLQILNGIVDQMNQKAQQKVMEGLEEQQAMLTPKQAMVIATPLIKNVEMVHEVGANSGNGNAPTLLFQPLWIATLLFTALLFLASRKADATNIQHNIARKLEQILLGAIAAFFIGFSLTWLAQSMLDMHIPNFLGTALFLTIVSFSFFLMILAVLSLVQIKGIALFVLLLFFGAPLLPMAPEMMPTFYANWIHPWLPMRFMIDGLRELFFFEQKIVWSGPVAILTGIGVVSAIVLLLTALKKQK